MLLEELRDFYGTYAQMARELSLGSSTYRGWRAKGYIPLISQARIERETKGRFKLDIKHVQ